MHGDIFKEIKEALKRPDGMSQEVRDTLILSGIVHLYEEVEGLKQVLPMYRVLVVIGTSLVGFIIALMWGIFTGQVAIVFK